ERAVEGVARQALVPCPPVDPAEREQRAGPLERVVDAPEFGEGAIERGERARRVAVGRRDQAAAARSRAACPPAPERRQPLVLRQVRAGRCQVAERDQRLDRGWPDIHRPGLSMTCGEEPCREIAKGAARLVDVPERELDGTQGPEVLDAEDLV